MDKPKNLIGRIEKLNAIGVALSAEKNTPRLLEKILTEVKELTAADGGTLYLVDDKQQLVFEIMRNKTLGVSLGGEAEGNLCIAPIPLYLPDGTSNDSLVVAFCYHYDQTILISDVYQSEVFDFSGTREFDKNMNYRSQSFLAVPMKNHENDIIGVLQLINKINPENGKTMSFSVQDQRLAESLASQAAVALTNQGLIDEMRVLFESFVRLMASAIDTKSPYTGKHCRRVPVLTMALAEAASAARRGPLAAFKLTEDDRYTLEVASWMHDCGKMVTPDHVIDKATKLETIFDRIELLDTRFEVLKRDAEITKLKNMNQYLTEGELSQTKIDQLEQHYQQELQQLEQDREFLREANIGGEFMSEEAQQRVHDIAQRRWLDPDGDDMPFLSTEEVYNLNIPKGTLTPEERDVVNHHITMTINMLESLPFPKHLKNVPEYAGGHHERMDGRGYPKGLTREQMSVPARTMAIADIFEALTAKDRPYKDAKKLSEALMILGKMKLDNHIDPDLFDVFIEQKVYLKFADEFLDKEQIDIAEPCEIPGYPFEKTD